MMNILVTGSNGQLGNEMRVLSADSENKFIFSDVTTPEGVITTVLDISDIEAVRRTVSENCIDIVVNCAAYTNVDKAEDDSELAYLINATAAANLALAAKEAVRCIWALKVSRGTSGNNKRVPFSHIQNRMAIQLFR